MQILTLTNELARYESILKEYQTSSLDSYPGFCSYFLYEYGSLYENFYKTYPNLVKVAKVYIALLKPYLIIRKEMEKKHGTAINYHWFPMFKMETQNTHIENSNIFR